MLAHVPEVNNSLVRVATFSFAVCPSVVAHVAKFWWLVHWPVLQYCPGLHMFVPHTQCSLFGDIPWVFGH